MERTSPLLYAALAFSAGIVVGRHCWRPAAWWIVAVLVFSFGVLYFRKRRPRAAFLIALGMWLCLGAFNVQVQQRQAFPDISGYADGSEVVVTGHVIHEGYVAEAGFGALRQQIDVETEEVSGEAERKRVVFGIRLGIFAKPLADQTPSGDSSALPLYQYGQRLRFVAKLRVPHNYGNPGSFDYRSYLADSGICALGSSKMESVETLPGFYGDNWQALRSRIHRRIVDAIHKLWAPADAALMDAAVIGEDAFVFRSTRLEFQRSGTYHILVVSGMNVSILAFVVFWSLRRLRMSEALASVITIASSVGYACLTYVGAPVWRATLMMACYLMARMVYRRRSMLNALGAAALALLVLDPASLLGASFQLTFLSVLILAALAVPLLERSSEPYQRGLRHLEATEVDASLEPKVAQFRVDLRMIGRRLSRFAGERFPLRVLAGGCALVLNAGELLLVSALMQVGLALPMAWYFHRVTVTALAANALAVPLTQVLMPSAVMALALFFITPALAKFPAWVAAWSLKEITATVFGLGGLPIADLRVAMPSWWMAAAAFAALGLSMILVRCRPLFAAAGIGVLLASAASIALVPPRAHLRAGVLEMTSIDVGQGDATLLVSPQGRTLLVDAGGTPGAAHANFDIGEDVVSPYLWSRGLSRLDVVVVTHGHWDHVGGMRAVLANFRPLELWVGVNPPTESLAAILAYAHQQKIVVRHFGAGDAADYGGAYIRFLAPLKDEQYRRVNDDCLAMKVTFGKSSVLMEGDAEKTIERNIAREGPSAGLLKVGHHGSSTSTSTELLAAVRPQLAVVSVGRQNSYGHPRYDVLHRLASSGVLVYRTDVDGLLTFYLDGNAIRPAPR